VCFSPEQRPWAVGGTLQVLGQGKSRRAWPASPHLLFFPSHDHRIGVAASGTASFVLSVTPSSLPIVGTTLGVDFTLLVDFRPVLLIDAIPRGTRATIRTADRYLALDEQPLRRLAPLPPFPRAAAVRPRPLRRHRDSAMEGMAECREVDVMP
jgi:hypothetical protein